MAIAFDASVSLGTATSTSLTGAHTTSGSSRILFVGGIVDATTDVVTGVTYNGVAMTRVGYYADTGSSQSTFLYVLHAPATGSNNVVISWSGTHTCYGIASSYTGANQSSTVDSSITNTATTADLTTTTTTVADNAWLIMMARAEGGVMTAGANTFLRQNNINNSTAIFDSNGAQTPPGSHSLRTTQTSGLTKHVLASFSEPQFTGSDTMSVSDSEAHVQSQVSTISDTSTVSDSVVLGTPPVNLTKSSSTWTNQNKRYGI